jgi:hypothetical protein
MEDLQHSAEMNGFLWNDTTQWQKSRFFGE